MRVTFCYWLLLISCAGLSATAGRLFATGLYTALAYIALNFNYVPLKEPQP